MSLDGLQVPQGGFDLIYSSGVVHHMSDPRAGLDKLRQVLAAHGQIIFMVYGRNGRQPLYRLIEAIDMLSPRSQPLRERLAAGRALASTVRQDTTMVGPWKDAHTISDVEFVDRYLNVNETSYDIDGLFELIETAGLKHLRWCIPENWSVERLLPAGMLREQALKLPQRKQYKLIDQLFWRHRLQCHLCHPDNQLRRPASPAELKKAPLAINPECAVRSQTRTFWRAQKTEALNVLDAQGQQIQFSDPNAALVVMLLRDQAEDFAADELFGELEKLGLSQAESLAALQDLLDKGYLYRLNQP